MNFEFMPELKSHYGYPLCIATMLTAAIGMLAAFRYKKWI